MAKKKITVATFNVENLFSRFKFRGKRYKRKVGGKTKYYYKSYTPAQLQAAVADGFIIDNKKFKRYLPVSRKLTAQAIRATRADFVALQEIENLDTLKYFNSNNLKGKKRYNYPFVIDGNDPRFIDVGFLSRLEFDFIRTHQYDKRKKSSVKIFSRDCLEVHLKIGQTTLPIFVNHLKSMMGGRAKTKRRRLEQCERIIDILKARFGSNYKSEYFIIMGDLNDYIESGKEKESGLRPLLTNNAIVNVVNRLSAGEQWTHYYKRAKWEKAYRQLDYILLSKKLADSNPTAMPSIIRGGMPLRVNKKGEPAKVKKSEFFKDIGGNLKASDHCPVVITLMV